MDLDKHLLDAVPDGLLCVDKSGAIFRANPMAEEMFGYAKDELLGKKIEDLIPERYRSRHVEHRHDFVQAPRVRAMGSGLALQARRKDGTEIPVEINLSPLLGLGQDFTVAVVRDVTVQRRAQEALRVAHDELRTAMETAATANRELETFSYSVAHDLRAPLRSISGFSLAVLEDYGDKLDETATTYLQRSAAAASRMGNLIDDLLKLARVARAELALDGINLSEVARKIETKLRETYPARRVSLRIQDQMLVQADPKLMEIALENLLNNAWKFTAHKPEANIEVGCRRDGPRDIFFVRDNGAGFDMAHSDNLFAPFKRLHKPSEFEGTGVGLATVQRILNRHGGKVWAESVVGIGSTFYFTLN